MKLPIILTLALAIVAGCSNSSTNSPTTTPSNAPPGWSDSLAFAQYSIPSGFASFGSDIFLITQDGIYYTTDDGLTVIHRDSGLHFNVVAGSIFTKDNFLFASVYGSGFVRSTDLGKTWKVLPMGGNYTFVYGNNLYNPSGDGNIPAYRSTDNGDTWTSISAGLPSGYGKLFVEIGGKFYITPGISGLWFTSTDQGTTWASYTGPAISVLSRGSKNSNYTCKAVTADGTTLIGRGTAYTAPDTVALWGAPRGSDVFTSRMTGFPQIQGITSIVVSGNNVFAAGLYIFHSSDNGMTWTNITPDKPTASYTTLGIAHGLLFAGGSDIYSQGVLVRRPLSDFN